jgi:hypothetical protein
MNGGKKDGDIEDSGSSIVTIRRALENLSHADLLALAPDIANALRRTSTEWWWMKNDVFQAFERNGFHITQAHYYSPLPDAARLPADLWDGPRYLNSAFALDSPAMLSMFGQIAPFAAELADIPRTADSGYYWDNEFFPNFDAIVYYGLCRRFRPAMVLEIGAGFSTLIVLRAAERNGTTRVRCIEPYPSPALRNIAHRLDELIVRPVQDVPMDVYGELRSGDILFVDTSHVSKVGSDLHRILFQVLPALPGGVIIHFHDIFLPREYPSTWVVERNWFWNEQYLLLAFLMFNAAFRVLLLNNHFLCTNAQAAERALGGLKAGPLSGASLWLRKEEDGGAGGNSSRF